MTNTELAASHVLATALIGSGDRTVLVTVQTRTRLSPAQAFDIIVPIDLSLVFTGWGPFPGVRRANNQSGPWDRVGTSRNPDLSDGSTATETLTEYTLGHSFAYELTDFTGLLRRLIEGIRGEWTFTPDGESTLIRWCYEFKPLRRCSGLVRFVVAPLWRRYMIAGVGLAASAAERIVAERIAAQRSEA